MTQRAGASTPLEAHMRGDAELATLDLMLWKGEEEEEMEEE